MADNSNDAARGETVSRITRVDTEANTILAIRTVKPSATSDVKTRVEWTFNLDGVTHEELLELAARSLVIDAQRTWRNMSAADRDANAVRDWDVRAMLDAARTRTSADPVKKAAKLVEGMSDDERRAFLEMLKDS